MAGLGTPAIQQTTTITVNSNGKTMKTVTGTVSSSGDNTVINSVSTKRLKIFAYALFSATTTSNTCIFKDGSGGTSLWTIPLQAPASSTIFGANLAVDVPSFLFATTAGNALILNLSQAQTVTYSLTYWDDDVS